MFFLLLPFPLLLTAAFLLLRSRARTIYGSLSKTPVGKDLILPYSPTELTRTDIASIVLQIILRYLPFYGAPRLISKADGFELPAVRLTGPLRINERDVALFKTAVKSSGGNVTGATNPILLVALTTPALIATLTHPASPIKVVGAVNTRNRFTYHDPELCCSASDLMKASKASELVFTTSMGGSDRPARRKKRGVEFEVKIVVSRQGKAIFTQDLSFLQFLPRSTKPVYTAQANENDESQNQLKFVGMNSTAPMQVPAEGPRQYAASCKDYNPIHVSSLAAKIFGFKSAIAHGNLTIALALQQAFDDMGEIQEDKRQAQAQGRLTSTMPQEKIVEWLTAQQQKYGRQRDVTVEVAFLRPVTPLPASLDLTWSTGTTSDRRARVELTGALKGKTCIAGSVECK